MDRIGCGLLPPAALKGDTFSTNNDFHNFTITDSSCHSTFSLKNYGGVDFINPKINWSNKSGETGINAGIMNSKGMHKYVERKRRRDMKTLFSALRSLLPEEYVMGKFSQAEQLSESAKYINHLHKKIQELTQTREEMRKEKLCRDLSFSVPSETCPIVKVTSHGWGVLVSTNTLKCQIVLSDLLLTLGNNGLDIISAVASAMDERVFHTIHAKVADHDNFDIKTLCQSIRNLVGEKSSDASSLHK